MMMKIKKMQESTFRIADLDGELAGFDYDYPATTHLIMTQPPFQCR